MNTNRIIDFWIEEANEALRVAWHLFEKGDYSYGLFFGHLAAEKTLKAIIVKRTGEQAPYIHNLIRLSEKAQIPLSETRKELLDSTSKPVIQIIGVSSEKNAQKILQGQK